MTMLGLCEFVRIHVSGLELEVHFYCMREANFHLLLGVPFLHLVAAKMTYNKDGSADLEMRHNGKLASLMISPPGENGYLFDVPGQAYSSSITSPVIIKDEDDYEAEKGDEI